MNSVAGVLWEGEVRSTAPTGAEDLLTSQTSLARCL